MPCHSESKSQWTNKHTACLYQDLIMLVICCLTKRYTNTSEACWKNTVTPRDGAHVHSLRHVVGEKNLKYSILSGSMPKVCNAIDAKRKLLPNRQHDEFNETVEHAWNIYLRAESCSVFKCKKNRQRPLCIQVHLTLQSVLKNLHHRIPPHLRLLRMAL